MKEAKSSSIPSMSVGKMIKKLSNTYCTVISSGLPVKTIPSVMLWGPPGVGKSQAVRGIAKEIEKQTGKKRW